MKITDPAIDLAVVAAVMSSNFDIAIQRNTAFIGEVGLSGEVRPVTRIENRISEASKMGIEKIFIPKGNLKGMNIKCDSEIIEVSRVEACFREMTGR